MFGTENNIMDQQSIRKILVIQFRPFGDVLLATSYLEALKERFPKACIDFLVKKPFDDILFNFISKPFSKKDMAVKVRETLDTPNT